ncbi:MAG: NUDIX hydrolase [Spirochaetes bacterium]|nr:NUDIX hydrolase [Spirochaetota bacterium]
MKKIKIKIIRSENVFFGEILRFKKDDILINTVRSIREYVEYPEAAAIIPVMKDGRIIMVEQYRYANKCFSLEIPAGKKDQKESIKQCAKRELEEETGYKAKKIKKLIQYFPAISYSTEVLHIFLAKDLQKGKFNPDKDEFIAIRILSMKEILQLITDNIIKDSKTILSILYYASFYSQDF